MYEDILAREMKRSELMREFLEREQKTLSRLLKEIDKFLQ